MICSLEILPNFVNLYLHRVHCQTVLSLSLTDFFSHDLLRAFRYSFEGKVWGGLSYLCFFQLSNMTAGIVQWSLLFVNYEMYPNLFWLNLLPSMCVFCFSSFNKGTHTCATEYITTTFKGSNCRALSTRNCIVWRE